MQETTVTGSINPLLADGRSNDKRTKTAEVIHSSTAKYDWISIALMCIAPCSMLVSLRVALQDPDPKDRRNAIRSIAASTVALAIVFGLVLPRSYHVLSDYSIRVVTLFGKHWSFGGAIDAFDRQGIMAEPFRPKFKFATSFRHERVIVRRELGSWDLLLSPSDPGAFVQAVKSMRDETVE